MPTQMAEACNLDIDLAEAMPGLASAIFARYVGRMAQTQTRPASRFWYRWYYRPAD